MCVFSESFLIENIRLIGFCVRVTLSFGPCVRLMCMCKAVEFVQLNFECSNYVYAIKCLCHMVKIDDWIYFVNVYDWKESTSVWVNKAKFKSPKNWKVLMNLNCEFLIHMMLQSPCMNFWHSLVCSLSLPHAIGSISTVIWVILVDVDRQTVLYTHSNFSEIKKNFSLSLSR